MENEAVTGIRVGDGGSEDVVVDIKHEWKHGGVWTSCLMLRRHASFSLECWKPKTREQATEEGIGRRIRRV